MNLRFGQVELRFEALDQRFDPMAGFSTGEPSSPAASTRPSVRGPSDAVNPITPSTSPK